MNRLADKGYVAVTTPDAVNPSVARACGFQPRDDTHHHMYHIENENLVLAATSELLLAALNAERILEPEDLPLRYVGFSHCFRAGEFHFSPYFLLLFLMILFSPCFQSSAAPKPLLFSIEM